MDRKTLDEVKRILGKIEELRARLDEILAANDLQDRTGDITKATEKVRGEAEDLALQHFAAALGRLNLKDADYQLLRIIDGDTLEVLPPPELQPWMRDVHIRLYGVDAPESNTELGPTYTEILARLCGLNDGHLRVVWERERHGTEYGGFPTASFERGIANVFVELGEGKLLYVNSVLASLPDVRIERGSRRLIRAARHVREWPRPVWHHWHRHWPYPPFPPWPPFPVDAFLRFLNSSRPQQLRSRLGRWAWHRPWFVWGIDEDVLPPNSEWPADLSRVVVEFAEGCGCPVCERIAHEISEEFPRMLEEENATPFDLFLLLAYAWGHPTGSDQAATSSDTDDAKPAE